MADRTSEFYEGAANRPLGKQVSSVISKVNKLAPPIAGPDGSVVFIYGLHKPNVVCAVLQICDIALEPGELINTVQIGDSVRWLIEPAITGSGEAEVQHIVIKPSDVDLKTSLAIYTNIRTYHIELRSHRTQYMPLVKFSYDGNKEAASSGNQWQALSHRANGNSNRSSHSSNNNGNAYGGNRGTSGVSNRGAYGTPGQANNLSFDYSINGKARWKPIRVWNDGIKTFLEMNRDISKVDAPTLLVIRSKGGLFKKEETNMVNYRIQDNQYIVDAIPDRIILVSGVGKRQERVTVIRKGR